MHLVNEVSRPRALSAFGPDWAQSKLTNQLVLLGTSFGGLTMMHAARTLGERCAGVVTFDPLMYPIHRDLDTFKVPQKTLLVCTENFQNFLDSRGAREAKHDNSALIERFLSKNPKAQAKYLKRMSHQDLNDRVVTDPLWFCLVDNNLKLPERDFAETYMLNAWLALDFMYQNGITRLSDKAH